MEATSSERLKTKKEKTKQTTVPPTSSFFFFIIFAMIMAVVYRLGRPLTHSTCSFDASNQKVFCKGKGLTTIPPDIPDSTLTLHMGETLEIGENHLPVLRRENFTRFKNLRELALVRCDIENISEEPFADLRELRRLDLRFNRIAALTESSFDGLTDLDCLLLSNNPIQVLNDNVFQGLRIQTLEFANNPVLWRISPRAFHESDVSSIVFNRCNLKGIKSETLTPLANSLRRLQISNNLQPMEVKEETFRGFNLERLHLVNCGLTSVSFLKHGDHKEINLDGNPLETLKIPNVDYKSKKKPQKSTTDLSVSGTKISRISREALSIFNHLETLNLSSNNLTTFDAEDVEDLDNVTHLDLSHNNIVYFDGDFSKELPELESLLLNGNDLESIPSSMESFFSRLENVTLDGNPFHCNCEMRWMIEWTDSNPEKYEQLKRSLACSSPEVRNLTEISLSDLKCRSPIILNATIDADGMTLVCTAEGDPAPTVSWHGPFGEESSTVPPKAKRRIFETKGRLTLVKDGNYTCTAENLAGRDSVVVDTNSIPSGGVRFLGESQKIRILETPSGFVATIVLLGILAYVIKNQ